MATNVLADLSDADLVSYVRRLLTSGAKLEVETLLALNVIHERKLYRPAGCGSFHVYCVNVLRMSDDTAGRRSKVGKLLRLYPALVRDLIETEAASVTALWKLEPVITEENAERLLNEVRGKTVREVELMVVREAPRPAVQSGFRTVFAPSLSLNAEHAATAVDSNAARHAEATGLPSEVKLRIDAVSATANSAPPRSKKKAIEPRAVDHYAFSANMNEATKTMLREAMDVGNFENYDALFAAAIDSLRTELLKKKYALVAKPRSKLSVRKAVALLDGPSENETGAREVGAREVEAREVEAREVGVREVGVREVGVREVGVREVGVREVGVREVGAQEVGAQEVGERELRADAGEEPTVGALVDASTDGSVVLDGSRPIPAMMRRAVYIRDGGRCTFMGSEGRCTETRHIELHHVLPVAMGGQSVIANVTLHCRAHNIYQAELDFGAAHMGQFVARRAKKEEQGEP